MTGAGGREAPRHNGTGATTRPAEPPARPHRPAALAAVVDVVCVLAFVIVGRRTHAEASALAGIATTAWPFLAGLLLGWLVPRSSRTPLQVWPTAVLLWLCTVAGGLGLRLASGQGVSGAFPLVAAGALALLLIGWRLLARLFLRHRP